MLPGDLCTFAICAIQMQRTLKNTCGMQRNTAFIKILLAMFSPYFRQAMTHSHFLVHITVLAEGFMYIKLKVSF